MQLNTDTSDLVISDLRIEDPIAPDDALDPIVVTTRRAISRVVHVAAEAASRFEREGVPFDPVAWMVAPRRLFSGQAAIDACMRLDDFQRAILLHGLSLGLDADPADIDALGDDDDCDDVDDFDYRTDSIIAQGLYCDRGGWSAVHLPHPSVAFLQNDGSDVERSHLIGSDASLWSPGGERKWYAAADTALDS